MANNNTAMTKTIRILFSILLAFGGMLLILIGDKNLNNDIVSKIGLAFLVGGVTTSFQEIVLRKFESDEAAEKIVARFRKNLLDDPIGVSGIRLISPQRKYCEHYSTWAFSTDAQDMFFAGRSVLHRIDKDIRRRSLGSAETIISKRLSEGCNINILIIDPRSDLISRLAREEGQEEAKFLSDLAKSIGICKRLGLVLENLDYPPESKIDIRLYDEIPYFSYHKTENQIIIGFYFHSAMGDTSAAYELIDEETKHFYSEHFIGILNRTTNENIIISTNAGSKLKLNHELISKLETFFENYFDEYELKEYLATGD